MDIGMGWYQWQLFCLCGFGWLADKYVPNDASYRKGLANQVLLQHGASGMRGILYLVGHKKTDLIIRR